MGQVVHCAAEDVAGLIARDIDRLDRKVKQALVLSATDGAREVLPNLPIAFGDLRSSLHVDAARYLEGTCRIVLSAPHAAAIERGSRPHMPPLEPLIKWVKLRGMQGLTKLGDVRSLRDRHWGGTTKAHAISVATQIKQFEKQGQLLSGSHVSLDVPVQIARAIQHAIALHGTKPMWPVRKALPKIEAALRRRMRTAVKG